jgi:hypothetical protein
LKKHSVLPGFNLTMGFTLFYLGLIVLIPLSATFLKSATLGWEAFWQTITSPRVMASYRLTFSAAFIGGLINAVFGLLVAWVLVRYEFVGKKLVDALVDLPFALPTAVAGIALATIYSDQGWLGQWFAPLGIRIAYMPLGVMVALTFIGLPFVVRTVQPILEDFEAELEEAAASLPGCLALADLLARHPPERQMGSAVWRHSLQRPGHGRVRRGVRGIRPHPQPHHDHPPARRDSLQRVQQRRRLRRGLPARVVGPSHIGAQKLPGMASQARKLSGCDLQAAISRALEGAPAVRFISTTRCFPSSAWESPREALLPVNVRTRHECAQEAELPAQRFPSGAREPAKMASIPPAAPSCSDLQSKPRRPAISAFYDRNYLQLTDSQTDIICN